MHKYYPLSRLASAVSSAFATFLTLANPSFSYAQTTETNVDDKTLSEIVVTATPFNTNEGTQILAPAKILSGDELHNKLANSLGDMLSHELGVSSSAFGAGASRPIIRGMEGSRVKILQNGMSVADVSSISNDHAVATEVATARQVEILRGPSALLYGSGAIGGLVNVVNDRIPTVLEPKPTGEMEFRYSTVDKGNSSALSVDGSAGPTSSIGLHLDGNIRRTDDYKIPGSNTNSTLPWSYTRADSVGFGMSTIHDWGYIGASVANLNNRYGIPTTEGSQIDQSQTRYDVQALVKQPWNGWESFKFKLGYTDYKHSELDLTDVPQTNFANRALESRWELTHNPIAAWHGTLGIQTEESKFSALSAGTGGPDTVPVTKSRSVAGFLVEERDFGPVHVNAGLRLESVQREPVSAAERSFHLASYSLGGLWTFTPGYAVGSTLSIAQRAPSTEELYSGGPHDATATFDKGNPNFEKETSRNIELSLQKTTGLLRWKANVFQNRAKNFIYGQLTGNQLDDDGNPGGDLKERVFSQADATIRGAEVEISHNLRGEGLSLRGFADTSRATLDDAGNLPLQPSTRFGIDVGYKQNQWRSGVTITHAKQQDRLAAFETITPAYTLLDANLSYTQRYGTQQVTWFVLAKNMLNQDIRLSTSVLKDVAPLPGRNFVVGVRTAF